MSSAKKFKSHEKNMRNKLSFWIKKYNQLKIT